jgi:CP family cyanate transporter-like MFS transporter
MRHQGRAATASRSELRDCGAARPGALVLPLAALTLVAFNLRGPVASVGPLLGELRTNLALHGAAAALLPTLPVLCFGVLAFVAPGLAMRVGLHRAVLAGLAALVAGLAMRSAGTVGLFAGTLLLGAGIAVVNVLLPAVVKADFADRLPLATALTTSSIALSASLGAGLAEPLRAATGGPLSSLAVWLLPASAGLLAWVPFARNRRSAVRAPGTQRVVTLLRDRTALAVTAYFGLQALAFYTMLAWLPSVLVDAGVPVGHAGMLLALAAFLGAPVAFVVPRLAARSADQGGWVVLVAAPSAVGLVGLLVTPLSAPWLWAVLLGLGTAGSFPLALTLVLMRSNSTAQAARLSAVAQGIGYVLASTGPFVIGLLHEVTAGWGPPLMLLLALLVGQVLVGRRAARDRLVVG